MAFKIVESGEGSSEDIKTEESCYCVINTKDTNYSFFIRVSDEEKVILSMKSGKEEFLELNYLQRVFDPIEEDEFLAEGKAIIKTSSITGVCFEWHDSTPIFEG